MKDNKKLVLLSNFDLELKKQIKIKAMQQDKTMTDYIQDVMREKVMQV